MFEYEPGVAAAFADAAVGDDFFVGGDAGGFVDVAKFVGGLKGTVGIYGSAPWNADGAGDVSSADGTFVWVAFHMEFLAAEFFGAADVDELSSGVKVMENAVAENAVAFVVAIGGDIVSYGIIWYFAGHGAVFLSPFETAAIHNFYAIMAEEGEDPEGVCCPPVAFIAIEDDGGFGGDTDSGHEGFKFNFAEVVAAELVVEVAGPVYFYGAGNVSGGIEKGVFVGFYDPYGWVIEMLGDPVCADEGIWTGVAALLNV